jgi:succinate dehydrogenase/fumarate reductase cytochrome b subunit
MAIRVDRGDVIAGVGLADRPRKSRWPARMDVAQSASGLALGLFMWGHMFFVSTILISHDAMWMITKMFEGYYVFGQAFPWIVSVVVAIVSVLFMVHAILALRKFPAGVDGAGRHPTYRRAHAAIPAPTFRQARSSASPRPFWSSGVRAVMARRRST